MFSKNLKKKVAVLLTGVMVLGMTVTASAGENGVKEGTGNFEGHVNRTVVAVQLPTVAEGATPFNYVMDSEGLIPETNFATFTDFSFIGGATTSEDNIYFKQADGKYYSESESYTVSNNSSVSVNVTMEVAAKDTADSDATLVATRAALNDAEDASLYLALNVKHPGDAENSKEHAITATEKASASLVLEGKSENYEVILSANQPANDAYPHWYNFVLKDDKEAKDFDNWDTVSFNVVGKANKVDDAEGKTAPNLEVTWKFETMEEAAAGAEAAATAAAATEAANNFKTKYATILAKDAESVEYADLAAEKGITAALTEYATLSEAAQGKLTAEKAKLDELKTAAEALAITDETGSLQYVSGASAWYIGKTTSAGISDSTFAIESVTLKKGDGEAVDVKAIATVEQYNGTYWIKVPYAAGAELGITYAAGTTYTSVAVVGTTRYTATKSY